VEQELAPRDPRRVDRQVQGTELGHSAVDRVLHVVRDGHVRFDRNCGSARLLDSSHRLVKRI
jgi:hypothetical protein